MPLFVVTTLVKLESLSKTTKYEDEGEDVYLTILPSAHYLAHTELDVTGGCSTCLPMCRCL